MPLPSLNKPPLISKTQFKARALEYFRRVEETGQTIVITDKGVPVLQLLPFRANPEMLLESLRGSVLHYQTPLEPVGESDWDLVP